jgi:AmmeMemoRadiSam system protein B
VKVRPPAVAGRFYPGDPDELHRVVRTLLAGAGRPPAADPAALVVPHAGYVYSGPVAASAYAGLSRPARVVLAGPAHFVPLRGIAVSGADAWRTPLGDMPVDPAGRECALRHPIVAVDDAAHAPEHSLEVQLPFLQEALGGPVPVLPLLVGDIEPAQVADVFDAVWDDGTLLLASTDLSHYLPHDAAAARDARTVAAVAELRSEDIGPGDACGRHPLRGLLTAARHRGLSARVLDVRTSGETAGGRDRVVGYAAVSLR